jgi:hypothetical protein
MDLDMRRGRRDLKRPDPELKINSLSFRVPRDSFEEDVRAAIHEGEKKGLSPSEVAGLPTSTREVDYMNEAAWLNECGPEYDAAAVFLMPVAALLLGVRRAISVPFQMSCGVMRTELLAFRHSSRSSGSCSLPAQPRCTLRRLYSDGLSDDRRFNRRRLDRWMPWEGPHLLWVLFHGRWTCSRPNHILAVKPSPTT